LQRRLACLQVDDEAHSDTASCGELLLPQPLRLAFFPNDPAECVAIHFPEREYNRSRRLNKAIIPDREIF
jgi:hypothetical protein